MRLTEDANQDLARLQKKDPQILRAVFKKMLLLERSPDAGEPLLGALVGFRKLVVGNRDYRIVWRRTQDRDAEPLLEIAEVWAAGARADSEVYEEMTARVDALKKSEMPAAQALAEVIERMGKLYADIEAHPEPSHGSELPHWLSLALQESLHLTLDQIKGLDQEKAQHLLSDHWSQAKDHR